MLESVVEEMTAICIAEQEVTRLTVLQCWGKGASPAVPQWGLRWSRMGDRVETVVPIPEGHFLPMPQVSVPSKSPFLILFKCSQGAQRRGQSQGRKQWLKKKKKARVALPLSLIQEHELPATP